MSVSEPFAAKVLRRANGWIGWAEAAVVTTAFVVLVAVGAGHAIMSQFGDGITGADELVRYMVFFIAMSGAALTAGRRRMISMDILARLLSPRGRAVTRVLSSGLVVFVSILAVKVGIDVRATQLALEGGGYEHISPGVGMLALPIGFGLIALHYVLHGAIDLTHLIAGTEPPEGEEAPI